MPPVYPDWTDIAVAILFTSRPSDRALAGWCQFGNAMALLGDAGRERETP
jgi:hypothetical protein